MSAGRFWRVGHASAPTDFAARELYAWNHRFDDAKRRFRSIYGAATPETALREMLADLRPNAAAIQRFTEKFGPTAAKEIPAQPVTASWRRQHVLVNVEVIADGRIVDLCDPATRHDIEEAFASVLAEHGVDHLDLSQVTTKDRPFTQTLSSAIRDELGAAGIAFPSRLDGGQCVCLFEGRGTFKRTGPAQPLTNPAPPALTIVCDDWDLQLEPT